MKKYYVDIYIFKKAEFYVALYFMSKLFSAITHLSSNFHLQSQLFYTQRKFSIQPASKLPFYMLVIKRNVACNKKIKNVMTRDHKMKGKQWLTLVICLLPCYAHFCCYGFT